MLLPFEVSHVCVQLLEELGNGEYGVVYKGVLSRTPGEETEYKTVAIKTTKSKEL